MSLRGIAAAASLLVCTAAAHAQFVINQGFENVASLASSGWVLSNQSTAGGTTNWFQGDEQIFPAQAGTPPSYIASNFNAAPAGGTIANWLITPLFSAADPVTVSFFARSTGDARFTDALRVGFSSGSAAFADFVLGAAQVVPGGAWTRYTFSYAPHGAGSTARFAIVYSGLADAADYVGIDTLTVAVPEPQTWALFAAGLAGVGWIGRRRRRRAGR